MVAKSPIICIIDDNPEDREIFRRYLLQDSDYQYQFFEEETGEQGLELCRSINPDCILLDYNLPDISGLEFLVELADETGLVPYAVVMLTGLDDEAVALQAMKNGAQDYLVKDEMTAGNLLRAIHNAIERTMLRQTLEKQRLDLEKKNQEMQAFAYALAHDLRAPLRAINGFSQIVAEDYSARLDEQGRHYIENIVRSCTQMDRLIEELLQYTRIEHRPIRAKIVELHFLLSQIVASFQERCAEKQATITLAPNIPQIYGDPVLINQIFTNLLDNALTYQRPGVPPQIRVDWQADGHDIIIRVEDNGIGIAPRHYERIFNIFQRLHSDDEYAGTGIGLAIVKKATELMDGRVWVISTPEQGSTFFVKLPAG